MKIIANFDKVFSEMIADKVKSRLSFKVGRSSASCLQQH